MCSSCRKMAPFPWKARLHVAEPRDQLAREGGGGKKREGSRGKKSIVKCTSCFLPLIRTRLLVLGGEGGRLLASFGRPPPSTLPP